MAERGPSVLGGLPLFVAVLLLRLVVLAIGLRIPLLILSLLGALLRGLSLSRLRRLALLRGLSLSLLRRLALSLLRGLAVSLLRGLAVSLLRRAALLLVPVLSLVGTVVVMLTGLLLIAIVWIRHGRLGPPVCIGVIGVACRFGAAGRDNWCLTLVGTPALSLGCPLEDWEACGFHAPDERLKLLDCLIAGVLTFGRL